MKSFNKSLILVGGVLPYQSRKEEVFGNFFLDSDFCKEGGRDNLITSVGGGWNG